MPTVAIGDLTKGQERAMRALLPMDYGWEFFLRQRFTISFASFLLLLLALSMLTSILLESYSNDEIVYYGSIRVFLLMVSL